MCAYVGVCDVGSPQEVWLQADLAANPGKHLIAIWHKPRFSSGSRHGNDPDYLTMVAGPLCCACLDHHQRP